MSESHARSLFDTLKVGDIPLANRFAMAPLTRNRSPNAVPKPITATYYAQRASAGLIITEGTAISHQAQGYSDVPGLYGDDQIEGWKKVTKAVHAAGGTIFCQLWHVGRVSHELLQPDNQPPVGPSAITAKTRTFIIDKTGKGFFTPTSQPRALDASEIPGIVHAFASAAANAVKTAGFDGVEIHGANGYLLDQFMLNGSNTRTDMYGCSIENRCRLPLEIVRAVIDAVGPGKVGIRFSPVSPVNDVSDTDPQSVYEYMMRQLGPLGLAYIHTVEGAAGTSREVEGRPFDYQGYKDAYRQAGGKGAWIVNNSYTPASAEQAVASGWADMVAFGRPFIANPDLVSRVLHNAPLNEGDPATYFGGDEKGYTDYPTLG